MHRLNELSLRCRGLMLPLLVATVALSGFLPSRATATGLEDAINGFGITAHQAGLSTSDTPAGKTKSQEQLNELVGTIVKTLLGLTGVIFMILIIAAGDLWMTAGGNEEKLSKARGMIFNGVVGLAIVFAAYLAADFIVRVALSTAGL